MQRPRAVVFWVWAACVVLTTVALLRSWSLAGRLFVTKSLLRPQPTAVLLSASQSGEGYTETAMHTAQGALVGASLAAALAMAPVDPSSALTMIPRNIEVEGISQLRAVIRPAVVTTVEPEEVFLETWFWGGMHWLPLLSVTLLLLPAIVILARSIWDVMSDDLMEETDVRNTSQGDAFPFEAAERTYRVRGPPRTGNTQVTGAYQRAPASPPFDWGRRAVSVMDVVRQEGRDLVLRVAGVAVLGFADVQMARLLAAHSINFPPTVLTLMALFASLCTAGRLAPKLTDQVMTFFTPAAAFLSRWMALMFVPMLCNIPTVAHLITLREVGLMLALISIRCLAMTALEGRISEQLFKGADTSPLQPLATPAQAAPKAPSGPSLPGPALLAILSIGVVTGLNGLVYYPQYTVPFRFLLHLSVMALSFTTAMHFQQAVAGLSSFLGKVFQPVLLSCATTLLLIRSLAIYQRIPFAVGLSHFNTGVRLPIPGGAGDLVVWLLSPTVVAMAFGLYQKRSILFRYAVPLLSLTLLHSAGSMVLTAVACRFLNFSIPLAFSALTHSATVPLAVEATKVLALGSPSLSAAIAVSTGVVGAMGGLLALDAANVKGVMARGIAVGANSHGLGTANIAKEEPPSAPFAAMSFACVGTFTASLCSIPAFQSLLLRLVTG